MKHKGQMAKSLVYYCIATLSITLVWAMIVKTMNTYIDLTDILTFAASVFGGELLMLLLKRIFAKPKDEDTWG